MHSSSSSSHSSSFPAFCPSFLAKSAFEAFCCPYLIPESAAAVPCGLKLHGCSCHACVQRSPNASPYRAAPRGTHALYNCNRPLPRTTLLIIYTRTKSSITSGCSVFGAQHRIKYIYTYLRSRTSLRNMATTSDMDIAKDSSNIETTKTNAYGEDSKSIAEGQMINHEPECIRGLDEDEIKRLNRKLVRKMDTFILPTIGILYILNYIDRQNLSAAKLEGIMEDLNMTTQQFATAVSILFVGYLPFQIPSNLIITRISRPGMYICLAVTIWGAISAATSAVNTYGELLAVRAILGMVEAVFFPGAVYYLSAWYTKKELGKRFAGLYIAQQVGNAFGGLFAAAILELDGTYGIAGWRWLFIVEGSITVGVGIICACLMPEFPHNTRMLSQAERDFAVWRIESEAGAAEGTENESVFRGFAQALSDPKLLLLIFCNLLSQGQGSIANYFPTLVDSLGYSSTVSLLLTAPPYILAGFVYYGIMFVSDKKNTAYVKPLLQNNNPC